MSVNTKARPHRRFKDPASILTVVSKVVAFCASFLPSTVHALCVFHLSILGRIWIDGFQVAFSLRYNNPVRGSGSIRVENSAKLSGLMDSRWSTA